MLIISVVLALGFLACAIFRHPLHHLAQSQEWTWRGWGGTPTPRGFLWFGIAGATFGTLLAIAVLTIPTTR
jgi:hypothetical protein